MNNIRPITIPRPIYIDSEGFPSLDWKYGPYQSIQEAFTQLSDVYENLFQGITVGIIEDDSITEYWLKDSKDVYTASDFVKKGATYNAGDNITIQDGTISCSFSGGDGIDITEGVISVENALTSQQKAWITNKIQSELSDQASNALSISVTTEPSTLPTYEIGYDNASEKTATVYVQLKVNENGSNTVVSADETPSGWQYDSTNNKYYKECSVGNPVTATNFVVTFNYGGAEFTKTKTSSAVEIQTKYPFWTGFSSSNNADDVSTVISLLTHSNGNGGSGTSTLLNNTNSNAYYWIITRGASTATLSGNSILKSAVNKSISLTPSGASESVSLGTYKVYISTNSVSAGGSLSNVVYNYKNN